MPYLDAFLDAGHSVELFLFMNVCVFMLLDFLYLGIGWGNSRRPLPCSVSQSLFSLLPEIQRIFDLEGTSAGSNFIDESEALRDEAICLRVPGAHGSG